MNTTAKEKRVRAGWPLIKVAVLAHVSEPTARIYEIDRNGVRDAQKRASLDSVYAQIPACRDTSPPNAA